MKEKMSKIVRELKPSGIRRFFDIVQKKENVISLGVGEPDFVTPWNVIEAAFYSMEQGHTHYTSNYGLLELRLEISHYLKKYDLEYNDEEIIVTVGGSEGINLALRAVIDAGDEIIIPDPIFVPYEPIASLYGGKAVSIDTSKAGFKLTPELLRASITDKTKAVVLCFPNNPTGTTLTKEETEALAEVIIEKDIWCITDEIYSELTYEGEHFSIGSVEGMRERTIYLNGFSKAFAMTGWRVGYLCAPKMIIDEIIKIHQYIIMCAPVMSQYAAVEALRHSMKDVQKMKDSYDRRRRLISNGLKEIGFKLNDPKGAMYVFPDVSISGMNGEEFALELLEKKNIAVVPGIAFGKQFDNYIRCSYATSIEKIKIALKGMQELVDELKNNKK